jgi:aminoglycoside 6'-N-acetyltransferase I
MDCISSIKNDHLLDCAKLYVEVFNAPPWNDKWTIETATNRLTDIFYTPNFEGVIYVEEGQIKGAIFGNYEQFYDGLHYNLREMFVSTELQGTGIGSKLLIEFENHLRDIGVTTLILFTGKGNQTCEFYLKNGFSEWTSMAIMGKDI